MVLSRGVHDALEELSFQLMDEASALEREMSIPSAFGPEAIGR
jgi:hypothetical protein